MTKLYDTLSVIGAETCKGCKHLYFGRRQCMADKKNPIALNTATAEDGYIHVLRVPKCQNFCDNSPVEN